MSPSVSFLWITDSLNLPIQNSILPGAKNFAIQVTEKSTKWRKKERSTFAVLLCCNNSFLLVSSHWPTRSQVSEKGGDRAMSRTSQRSFMTSGTTYVFICGLTDWLLSIIFSRPKTVIAQSAHHCLFSQNNNPILSVKTVLPLAGLCSIQNWIENAF